MRGWEAGISCYVSNFYPIQVIKSADQIQNFADIHVVIPGSLVCCSCFVVPSQALDQETGGNDTPRHGDAVPQ